MAVTPEPGASVATPRLSLKDTLAVYLKRRVLIVLFLGFSSGLPLALSGSTLLVWMTESKVNLGTIGLFALVGTPYTVKFLWAPPRLAPALAVLAHRGDCFSRRLRSGAVGVCRCHRCAVRCHSFGNTGHRRRCLSGGKPERK